jgi:Rps23 Pro-64 3,4-dihydroxylase Tpa1-like proline 4-hydroxylase
MLLKPFPYFTAAEGFGDSLSRAILDWLETEAPWALVVTDFYEQHEFSLSDVSLPLHLAFLKGRPFVDDLRSRVERIFNVRLGEAVDCTVHKLVPGQRIRIHNDFIPGEATHRVLVQLNRGWRDDQGGFLMFFNSDDPADIHRVFSPTHDSVVGFAISEASHHAVSLVHGGERFTLVFSFYGRA